MNTLQNISNTMLLMTAKEILSKEILALEKDVSELTQDKHWQENTPEHEKMISEMRMLGLIYSAVAIALECGCRRHATLAMVWLGSVADSQYLEQSARDSVANISMLTQTMAMYTDSQPKQLHSATANVVITSLAEGE